MNWPKQETILSQAKKRGYSVQGPNQNGQYWIEANGRSVSWYVQCGKIPSMHCHRIGDDPDPMTDYSPGYFAHTVKAAMKSLEAA